MNDLDLEVVDDTDVMESWRTLERACRKCQWCKQHRGCKHGPDPYLFYFHDEIEMVWLCDECYSIRQNGLHLPDGEVDE